MNRKIVIQVPSFWMCACLIIIAIAVANLGDAIGKASKRLAGSCQANLPAHAGPRTP